MNFLWAFIVLVLLTGASHAAPVLLVNYGYDGHSSVGLTVGGTEALMFGHVPLVLEYAQKLSGDKNTPYTPAEQLTAPPGTYRTNSQLIGLQTGYTRGGVSLLVGGGVEAWDEKTFTPYLAGLSHMERESRSASYGSCGVLIDVGRFMAQIGYNTRRGPFAGLGVTW